MDAINGHYDILSKRQSIDELLKQEDLDNDLKEKLKLAVKAREFATKDLALPENDSYRRYADIKRPYVVWNVIASPTLSVKAKKWCFIFAGCISYRGYFNEDDANSYANKLQQQGYDVYVAGVQAYSTLGWFDDPLLNTMLSRSEARLVGIIFHELAHQKIYIDNDSSFNEAFATTVEQHGVKHWFIQQNDTQKYNAYLKQKKRDEEFKALLIKTREQLKGVYQSAQTEEQKYHLKQKSFRELQKNYLQLKKTWQGYNGYDKWMEQDLNNAHLALIATYYELVPAFQTLLKNKNNNLPGFYNETEKLGELPSAERSNILKELLKNLSK